MVELILKKWKFEVYFDGEINSNFKYCSRIVNWTIKMNIKFHKRYLHANYILY